MKKWEETDSAGYGIMEGNKTQQFVSIPPNKFWYFLPEVNNGLFDHRQTGPLPV